jgi:hypothetical protein
MSSDVADQIGLKPFACLLCRQRKVKCDRNEPCANCVKAKTACSFVPPAPSRRRIKKPPKEGLHARLSRYERILKSHGAKIDATEMQSTADESPVEGELENIPDDDITEISRSSSSFKDKSKLPKLVSRRDKSRYLDKYAIELSELCFSYDSRC